MNLRELSRIYGKPHRRSSLEKAWPRARRCRWRRPFFGFYSTLGGIPLRCLARALAGSGRSLRTMNFRRFRPDLPPAATLWRASHASRPPPGCNTSGPLQPGCSRVAAGLHPTDDRAPPGCNTRTRGRRSALSRYGCGFRVVRPPSDLGGTNGPKNADKPHFSPLSASKSTNSLASLKSGSRFPRFSVQMPFTQMWEGCMVGLNWIEVYGFSSRVFATKTFEYPGFRIFRHKGSAGQGDTLSPQMRSPKGFQGRLSTKRLPEDHPQSSSPSSERFQRIFGREGSPVSSLRDLHSGFANDVFTPAGDDRRFSSSASPAQRRWGRGTER